MCGIALVAQRLQAISCRAAERPQRAAATGCATARDPENAAANQGAPRVTIMAYPHSRPVAADVATQGAELAGDGAEVSYFGAAGDAADSAADGVLSALNRAVGIRVTHIRERSCIREGEPMGPLNRQGHVEQPSGEGEVAAVAGIVSREQEAEVAAVAVLFSGGLDSMLLAALAHRHVPIHRPIELLNVSFAGAAAPDRQTARMGVRELVRACAGRSGSSSTRRAGSEYGSEGAGGSMRGQEVGEIGGGMVRAGVEGGLLARVASGGGAFNTNPTIILFSDLVYSCCRLHLVEVDSTLSEVDRVKTHLLSLLCPSHTHMVIPTQSCQHGMCHASMVCATPPVPHHCGDPNWRRCGAAAAEQPCLCSCPCAGKGAPLLSHNLPQIIPPLSPQLPPQFLPFPTPSQLPQLLFLTPPPFPPSSLPLPPRTSTLVQRCGLLLVYGSTPCLDPSPTNFASPYFPSRSLLLSPLYTQDLNIGAALWLAARGEGRMIRYGGKEEGDEGEEEEDGSRAVTGGVEGYRAHARVVLVGTGADEQCGGYARYRTKFRQGGWPSLESEMREDVQRLWRRNLGRDDRCLSDHGREPRFPFLDEGVMSALLALPLPLITHLHLPPGTGDKLILRQIARKLGLPGAAALPKRAIQIAHCKGGQ
ncbi:unnamed protein product [Closterium sp. Yama58-4]|nr:unnamed protein product [Closterium sp. Yama58-4]